jgi:prepilin-type N-terminal cleavage/methylation domain-containing protein
MRSLREESGFSMPELLIASVIMVVVLSATLSVLDAASGNARRNEHLNEQQERARAAIDFLARDLRNVAASDPAEPAVERMSGYELVFRSVDPLGGSTSPGNLKRVQRVRYCLDQSTPSTGLWRQVQPLTTPSTPVLSTTSACPASPAYGSQRILAESVVNRRNSLDRPVFTYDSSASANVSSVGARLFVDLDVNERPPEVALASSVFLRNQNLGTRNRAPTAAFTATPQPGGAQLNGGASSDPDGQTLRYQWFMDGSAVEGATGPIHQYSGPLPRSFSLRVTDPGNLTGTAERTVTAS